MCAATITSWHVLWHIRNSRVLEQNGNFSTKNATLQTLYKMVHFDERKTRRGQGRAP